MAELVDRARFRSPCAARRGGFESFSWAPAPQRNPLQQYELAILRVADLGAAGVYGLSVSSVKTRPARHVGRRARQPGLAFGHENRLLEYPSGTGLALWKGREMRVRLLNDEPPPEIICCPEAYDTLL